MAARRRRACRPLDHRPGHRIFAASAGPNDVFDVGRGHDGWTVGDELVVFVSARVSIREEVELAGSELRGITVHEAARVAAAAGPGEILVSAATHQLAVGAGFGFV